MDPEIANNQIIKKRKINWYASLSEERKEEIRKKRRETYHANKQLKKPTILKEVMKDSEQKYGECMYTGTHDRATKVDKKRSRYSMLPEDKKETIRKKMRETYHLKKNRLSTNNCHNTSIYIPPKDSCSLIKGKEQLTYHSSFEIGSTSNSKHLMHRQYKSTRVKTNLKHDGILKISESHNILPHTSIHLAANDSFSSNKGKEQITYHSTFEIGSTSNSKHLRNRQCKSTRIKTNSKRGDILEISNCPDILPFVEPCEFCGAKRFYHETKNFCCGDGKIKLASNDVPEKLYNLYTSGSQESNSFFTYIQTYNNTFAFTSSGVKYDKSFCRRNKGIYTLRVQGQIYHYINELLPIDDSPSYLQLYFYDSEHEIENRLKLSNNMHHQIVSDLMGILEVNPYARFFRTLQNVQNLEDYRVIIRTDPILDQRIFNAPSESQVAAIWVDNDESVKLKERDIVVYAHSGTSHKVNYYYGCYDPLQYPLLFPYGDMGWHEGIKKN